MANETEIRAAFAEQAGYCTRLDADFTALLCTLLGERLSTDSAIGARVLGWPGNPSPFGDALALRLCGGLHHLARNGAAPALGRLYPPASIPDPEALWAALAPLLDEPALLLWLDSPPQTNEVGRAAALHAGLLVAADRFGLPLRLFELGASAGLNLQLDRYAYDLGGLETGDPKSPLRLAPDWSGPLPPAAEVRIAGRAGVDRNPLPLPESRDRLIAYVWPEQRARLEVLEAAIALASADPPRLDRADAADWLEATLSLAPEAGVVRLVFHSVVFHYLAPGTQERITAYMEAAGAAATAEAPLAWLRFEMPEADKRPSLRLRCWPGEEKLLAWLHPHGKSVAWVAEGPRPVPEAVETGWILLSGKELGGSDVNNIVTDDATPSGRQKTARRVAGDR